MQEPVRVNEETLLFYHHLTSGYADFEDWMVCPWTVTCLEGFWVPWNEVLQVPARLDLSSVEAPILYCA